MKILHLTLNKQWFDLIAIGEKTVEYRQAKPYWVKRLEGKTFDEIHFRNGYSKNSPFMRVEFKGITKGIYPNRFEAYFIELGKILEIKNWRG